MGGDPREPPSRKAETVTNHNTETELQDLEGARALERWLRTPRDSRALLARLGLDYLRTLAEAAELMDRPVRMGLDPFNRVHVWRDPAAPAPRLERILGGLELRILPEPLTPRRWRP